VCGDVAHGGPTAAGGVAHSLSAVAGDVAQGVQMVAGSEEHSGPVADCGGTNCGLPVAVGANTGGLNVEPSVA